ncbi:deoxyuridine 5'-triphosphate nucleotidohydrolase [Halanaerobium saccharolyticum]|jgi:dUTP pyrophosphatase|uniref:Deoxyuridine 5'-triphosphate nucleotidohydrolase n=1 Tax=Halanaerobium saccharolyticum TaxID=43595 RepID=A0A4R6S3F1_9FIRM|nr:dUTP diphosphatase [Halanaerobium saccharolyticum]TDP94152.1 deoxyuridine 5'-triphosphate nucleotidohydrolase [Halanaerobium saccharolyticum]
MEIKVERINKDIELPKYQHFGEDAGLDLHAAEELTIKSGEYKLIKTGLKIAVPRGYAAFVYPRSGLALKKGVTVLNADGVIDSGYRGEVGVILINHGTEDFNVNFNDRIAQLIIQQVNTIEWNEVESLSESQRGEGGFGHTGIKKN